MVDSSAGSMFSTAVGIFLSLLPSKVGRERLVYFTVSKHSVLILSLRRTKFEILLVTSSPSKTLTAYFVDFFALSRTAFVTSFLISLSVDSTKGVIFSTM